MRKLIILLVGLGIGAGCDGQTEAVDPVCVAKPRDANVVCTSIYQPVCGCDGKTYGNDCEAQASGITRFTAGACAQR